MQKLSPCKSCPKEVAWLKTRNDKNIPVDPESLPQGWDENTIFDRRTMTTHFETCPKASMHRGSERIDRHGTGGNGQSESSKLASKLNIALAALKDIGTRTTEPGVKLIAKTAVEQMLRIR